MFNDLLDNVIAVVIVLLVLSLVVQSIQSAVKKFFKIKSRQIEQSLGHLFVNIVSDKATAPQEDAAAAASSSKSILTWLASKGKNFVAAGKNLIQASPVLHILPFIHLAHPSKHPNPDVRNLFGAVTARFKELGRVSAAGKPVLDSIAKDDLLKVLEKASAIVLFPPAPADLATARDRVKELDDELAKLSSPDVSEAARAGLAEAQKEIKPLLEQTDALVKQNTANDAGSGEAGKKLQQALSLVGDLRKTLDLRLGLARQDQQKKVEGAAERLAALEKLEAQARATALAILRAISPFFARLQTVLDQITDLTAAIKDIDTDLLTGDANATFAVMQEALAPLLNDIQHVAQGGTVNPRLIVGDIAKLREIKLENVFKLLGEVQDKVEADRVKAVSANNTAQARGLEEIAKGLRKIAALITNLRQNVDAVLAPWRARLQEAEAWYDTVMQSFEERYNRSMKTWALVISFIVAVCLNANFFKVYSSISTNSAQRDMILQSRDEIQKLAVTLQQEAANPTPTKNPTATPTPTPSPTPPLTADQLKKLDDAKAQEAVNDAVKRWFTAARQEVDKHTDIYTGFGFKPLTWAKIDSHYQDWRAGKPEGWWGRRSDELKILLGWIVMALLLSAGAPFWQDTLESLFGVKNLLRSKSGTKNVEDKSGQGQPKQS